MSDRRLNVLVISNPSDRDELVGALAGLGIEARVGDGGDATLALYDQAKPEIVVMGAALDAGDARAIAAAIRSGPRGRDVRIVLVGETTGPIRNALDATDFEVDRFVGRPLSAKALGFAIRQLGDELAARPARPQPPRRRPGPTDQKVLAAMDQAITTFVQDAIAALDDAAIGEPEFEDLGDLSDDEIPVVGTGAVAQVAPDEETHKATAAEVAARTAADVWDAPPPARPVREPTLILSPNAPPPPPPRPPAASTAPPPVIAAPPPVAEEYNAPVPSELPWDDDVDDSPDDLAELQADLEGDGRARERDLPPSGGEFARELRRKMSAMAQRLFPGRGGGSGVDVGVSHDAHTEIDLAALSNETMSHYRDVAPAPAFNDTNPMRTPTGPGVEPESTGAGARAVTSVPARGDLTEIDVATLFARVFRGQFTGRLEFRRPPAEKVVHVVDGRPVFAASNLPHDRMGDLLYREGKITREHHIRSREIVVESGRRMGEILVDMGFLKPRELLPAVRRHIEDIIYSLFAWRSGEFSVIPGGATAERIRVSRHPAAIVLEGVRRKYGQDTLDQLLGSIDAVIAVKKGDPLSQVIGVADLNPAELAAIERLDGERTISEAALMAGVEPLTAFQLAFGLVALSVADVVHRGGDARQTDSVRSTALVGETDLAIDRQRVLAKFALVNESDYFMLLGVRRDASGFEIKRAYEAARRDYARDNFPAEVRAELAGEIDAINDIIDEAYGILRDDALRVSYLTHLRD